MCGFVGSVGSRSVELGAALSSIAHRGPDDRGLYSERGQPCVDLGFARLSILDLSENGHQPMCNERADIWLVFNGEIYNFRQLREQLEALGHSFKSQSDSECILHAYEQWGSDCPGHLRGMFAFAIWDSRRKELFLARDRLGIKPLFYWHSPDGIAFASEIKALLHLGAPREMDHVALEQYLRYLYVPRPRTMFRSIRSLMPGQWLVFGNGQVKCGTYWTVPTPVANGPIDLGAITEQTRELLDETVKLHLASDVPLGVFLSGGLDSTSLLACAARHSSEPIKTFCMTFGEGEGLYDERQHARLAADTFSTRHTEIPVQPDVASLMPQVVAHFDEPFGNPTALLSYVLARETRRHVTVCLAGDGGDEVFLGYPRYKGALLAKAYRRAPHFGREAVSKWIAPLIRDSTRGRHGLRRLREFLSEGAAEPEAMYDSWIGYFRAEQVDELLGAASDAEASCLVARMLADRGDLSFEEQIPSVDLRTFLPNNLLRYTDRMTMAHSLEARVPFCDHKLVELMRSVPFAAHCGLREDKRLLRRAMAGAVPDSILRRKKLGFNPPMGLWLNGPLREQMTSLLSADRLKRQGVFAPAPVQHLIQEHLAGRRDWSLQLWALLVFEEWHDQYAPS